MYGILLIPGISLLNHLGGQSTRIPDPRITCRVILIPLLISCVYMLLGASLLEQAIMLTLCGIGFALWAIPAWGEEFMAINGEDHRDYTKYVWINEICDFFMGTSRLSTLTEKQCKNWGTIWGTIRGMFLYPLFIALAYWLTPYSLAIGLICCAQGLVYRLSGVVLYAEYIWGAIIGAMLAMVFALCH